MDAFKFAFETTIVGLLALPWLALMISILLPPFQVKKLEDDKLLSKILEPAALSILVLALAYFLGSAVSPVATQLLDDPDMPTTKIRQIRADLYLGFLDWFKADPSLNTSSTPISLAAVDLLKCLPPPVEGAARRSPHKCWESSENLFLLQESAVLKAGTDKTERISRLHEQVIVLRGAVFNGFVFVVLCCFACFSRQRGEPIRVMWSNPIMLLGTLLTIALAGVLISVAAFLGTLDLSKHDITDPPIMESVLLFLGAIGFFTLLQGVAKRPYIPVALVFGLIITALAYGAWAWTEVLYDTNVIGAFFSPS